MTNRQEEPTPRDSMSHYSRFRVFFGGQKYGYTWFEKICNINYIRVTTLSKWVIGYDFTRLIFIVLESAKFAQISTRWNFNLNPILLGRDNFVLHPKVIPITSIWVKLHKNFIMYVLEIYFPSFFQQNQNHQQVTWPPYKLIYNDEILPGSIF